MTTHDALVLARTPRLTLRTKKLDDALNDYRWRRDPDLMRYDGASPIKETFTEFLRQLEADLLVVNPSRRMFAIDTNDGEHIGNLMYYNGDLRRKVAEVGMSIGETRFRGQGLGSEAMTAFLSYLWDAYPYSTLFLHTLEWNARAHRSFARAGFTPTSRVVRGGREYIRMEVKREWWLMDFEKGRLPVHPGAIAERGSQSSQVALHEQDSTSIDENRASAP